MFDIFVFSQFFTKIVVVLKCCPFYLSWSGLHEHLANHSAAWRRKTSRFLTREKRRRWWGFFFCSPLAAFLEFLFYIVLIWSIFLFIYFLRSYRATAYVIGVWSWWASGCCVRGAFSSCYSTGCQSGASNPPAPVPQPEMLKWFCCGLR